MEGLERHSKQDHQTADQILKKMPSSIKKKRRLTELQHRYNDYLSDDSEAATDQVDLPHMLQEHGSSKHYDLLIPKTTTKRQKGGAGAEKTITTAESIKDQYKLAKAQLNYILRENEMLVDEWQSTEQKLKRLRTERRVLLDALVRRGYNNEQE